MRICGRRPHCLERASDCLFDGEPNFCVCRPFADKDDMSVRDAVAQYLSPLYELQADLRCDADGCAHGRFFNARLSSRFRAICCLRTGRVIGHEAQVNSNLLEERGLNVWKLLDHAASDQESIVFDRLCRALHALNFYRQAGTGAGELFLNVHARLLAAVSDNHGAAFRRFLAALDLSHEKTVLQLPLVSADRRWELNFVADNYRSNGFRLALKAADAVQALSLLEQLGPDSIKIDAAAVADETVMRRLLSEAQMRDARIIFTRAETPQLRVALQGLASLAAVPIYVQDSLWETTPGAQAAVA